MSTKKKMLQAAAGNAGGGGLRDPNLSFLSHFDGDNNGVNNVFEDSSTNNNTMTVTGDVTQGSFTQFSKQEGEWGAEVSTNKYIYANNNSDFTLGDTFTIEAWIYRASDTDGNICGRWYSASGDHYLLHTFSGGKLAFGTGAGSNYADQSTNAVPIGEWVHVAVSNTPSSKKLFINGVNDGSFSGVNISGDGSLALTIGANTGGSSGFDGCISNLRIVKGSALYTSDFTPPTEALTAVTGTVLLTCQSNRFKDNSTSNHTLTTVGTPKVTPFSPFASGDAYDPAVNGGSAYFDGAADYLSAPNSSDWALGDGDFTIEAWVNVAQQSITQSLIGHWTNSSRGWQIRFTPNTPGYVLSWTWTTNGGTDYTNSGTTRLDYDTWNHVAVVRSGSNITMYVNGVTDRTFAGANVYAPNTPLVIGDWDSNAADFRGYMSDVRLVKGTAVYTSDFTPPTEPLTAVTNTKLLLNMDNAQAFDSAAQNNLTLSGNAKISNAQSKFGDTSLTLDGTGDWITWEDSTGLSGGDFTIEFFGYNLTGSGNWGFFSIGSTLGQDYAGLTITSGGTIFISMDGASWTYFSIASLQFPSPDNTWHHYAVCRQGGTLYVFKDGVATTGSGSSISGSIANKSGTILLGRKSDSTDTASGYVDEFRISKGVARYTADFTPPTAPFEDKG